MKVNNKIVRLHINNVETIRAKTKDFRKILQGILKIQMRLSGVTRPLCWSLDIHERKHLMFLGQRPIALVHCLVTDEKACSIWHPAYVEITKHEWPYSCLPEPVCLSTWTGAGGENRNVHVCCIHETTKVNRRTVGNDDC